MSIAVACHHGTAEITAQLAIAAGIELYVLRGMLLNAFFTTIYQTKLKSFKHKNKYWNPKNI
jgi:hypothetical protein